jgi:hypothetical protein
VSKQRRLDHEPRCEKAPTGTTGKIFPCPIGCGKDFATADSRNKHAARAPQGLACSGFSPEKATEMEKETADARAEKREKTDRKAKRQQLRALAGKHGGGGVVFSADSVRNILENSTSSHALMHADSFSPQFAELEEEYYDLGKEEVHDLLQQTRKGRDFVRDASRSLLEILFIVEGVAQVSKGLKNGKATLDAVHVLAQTTVLHANDEEDDPEAAEAKLKVILKAKKVLANAGSPLPIRLSLMFAFLFEAGCTPVFKEFAPRGVQWDVGK